MKKISSYIYIMLATVFGLSSCADSANTDYTPSEPTAEGCMKVYFDSSNPESFITVPGTQTSIEVTVSRVDATKAAEVPIICNSAATELSVPQSVTFEEGETSTSLTISYSGIEESKQYAFSLALPEEYVDHYTQLNGASKFSSYVMEATWNVYVPNDTIVYTTGGVENEWVQPLERLGDTNRYRIQDFMGSGLDYTFALGDTPYYNGKYNKNYKKIEPLANYYEYTDDGINGYYFWNDAKGELATFTTSNKTVSEVCFLKQWGDEDYSRISFSIGYAQLGVYWSTYADGTYDYYNYVYMYFEKVK